MENMDKKYLNDFCLDGYILHTAHFARGVYKKKGKSYYAGGKDFNEHDNQIYNYKRKLKNIHKHFYAMVDYLKDAFLLISYIKRKRAKFKKDKKEDESMLSLLADYLDELMSRNIRSFIDFYYILPKVKRKNFDNSARHYMSTAHYQHKKYFDCYSAEEFLVKYLNNNIYTRLNIFCYRIYESLDFFHNPDIEKIYKQIEEKERMFIDWV